MKKCIRNILLAIFGILLLGLVVFGLNGCSESETVNYNIRREADNFKVTRRVVALNTRTNEPLFAVEGKISLETDSDGDLNVTIKTSKDRYQLFYAHLSKDVTYTSVQIDESDVDPYAYTIKYFPPKKFIEHGMINLESTDADHELDSDHDAEPMEGD